jgi:sn-glycerol 3-phosphate transport system substrate-binding protein
MTLKTLTAATAVCTISMMAPAFAQTQIDWWHAMGGELGETILEGIVPPPSTPRRTGTSSFPVLPRQLHRDDDRRHRGLPRRRAARHRSGLRGRHRHHDGRRGRHRSRLPADGRRQAHRIRSVRLSCRRSSGYYTDPDGNMLSLPFNSSTPILYYNKDVFAAAGLDPEVAPPTTWEELESPSRARSWPRVPRNAASPLAGSAGSSSKTSRPGTTSPSARSQNGFGGPRDRTDGQRARAGAVTGKTSPVGRTKASSSYGGPGGGADAPPAFYAQHLRDVHELLRVPRRRSRQHPGLRGRLRHAPLLRRMSTVRRRTRSSAARRSGFSPAAADDEQRGVSPTFFNYPLLPRGAGCSGTRRPATCRSRRPPIDLSAEQGYYAANPGAEVSIQQITLNEPTDNSRGPALRQLRADPRRHRRRIPAPARRRRRRPGRARRGGRTRQYADPANSKTANN